MEIRRLDIDLSLPNRTVRRSRLGIGYDVSFLYIPDIVAFATLLDLQSIRFLIFQLFQEIVCSSQTMLARRCKASSVQGGTEGRCNRGKNNQLLRAASPRLNTTWKDALEPCTCNACKCYSVDGGFDREGSRLYV
jgi:hypothetical protein